MENYEKIEKIGEGMDLFSFTATTDRFNLKRGMLIHDHH